MGAVLDDWADNLWLYNANTCVLVAMLFEAYVWILKGLSSATVHKQAGREHACHIQTPMDGCRKLKKGNSYDITAHHTIALLEPSTYDLAHASALDHHETPPLYWRLGTSRPRWLCKDASWPLSLKH